MISNFLSRFPNIRSLTKHALVANDTNRKVVHRHSMGLLAHHLRCHVSRCSGGVLGVVWFPDSCDAQVCDLEVTIGVEDKVLWFYVSVDNALLVEIL
jgi:hypothetical protein